MVGGLPVSVLAASAPRGNQVAVPHSSSTPKVVLQKRRRYIELNPPLWSWSALSARTRTQLGLQQAVGPWRKRGLYRALRSFFKWIFVIRQTLDPFVDRLGNPVIEAHKAPQKLLYELEPNQTGKLLAAARCFRDQKFRSLLADSGARSGELASIQVEDLEMDRCRIKVWGKENKQGWLIFGTNTQRLLAEYIQEQSPGGSLFGLNTYGIQSMLRRLGDRMGFNCSAHSFRRGFARVEEAGPK